MCHGLVYMHLLLKIFRLVICQSGAGNAKFERLRNTTTQLEWTNGRGVSLRSMERAMERKEGIDDTSQTSKSLSSINNGYFLVEFAVSGGSRFLFGSVNNHCLVDNCSFWIQIEGFDRLTSYLVFCLPFFLFSYLHFSQ